MQRNEAQTKSEINITGIGIISGAGYGVADTKRIFQNTNSEPISSEAPFIKIDTAKLDALKIKSKTTQSEKILSEDIALVNLIALMATEEALESANLKESELENMRIGVCLGSTVGCSNFSEEFSSKYCEGLLPGPEALLSHFTNNTAQFISRYYKTKYPHSKKGPVQMISNACTSGADAIGIGASWLNADICDLVICGGTEVILPQIYYGFKSMQLCSPTFCKPFDKNRQGLTLGEGAGIVILEKSFNENIKTNIATNVNLNRGVNGNLNTKARLLGFGSASDAYHPTAPHPEALGLEQAALRAISSDVLKIDFINTHGTATAHNDMSEGRWIKKFASKTQNHFHVVATKGYTGHTLAAAGAIEAVLTVMSLMEQKLPISKGFSEEDPEIGIVPTTEIISRDFKAALSLSLGFGGTNSVLCLGRAL